MFIDYRATIINYKSRDVLSEDGKESELYFILGVEANRHQRPTITIFIKIINIKLQKMFGPDSERDFVKFPRIANKNKSVPGNGRSQSCPHDSVSAKAWFYVTDKAQFGFKSNVKREIASLTKIMTALCTIQICQKYNMNLRGTYFKVTHWASSVIGTSADLQQNAWMTIEDLLYGLMLPSGNDAALVLAQNLGAVLYFDKVGNKSMIQQIRSIDLTQDFESVRFYNIEFISYMNNKAKNIRMYKTRFANPHGLDHINNYSCCEDVYLMAKELMSIPILKKIVNSPTHKGTFKFFKDGKVVCKSTYWNNTNKLLQKSQVVGIKTGVTSKAGGCLATSFSLEKQTIGFIIVLGCSSTEARFNDTLRVMSWAKDEEDLSTTA